MNFVPLANSTSSIADKERLHTLSQSDNLASIDEAGGVALPFHLSLLQNASLSANSITALSENLAQNCLIKGDLPRNLAQELMTRGRLSPSLYYRLAAKRLGIGYLDQIADDQIILSDPPPKLTNMADIDCVLTRPSPKSEGMNNSPNRALIMAPEGEALDRLVAKLQELPDLGNDLYLITPAILQEALRRARRADALSSHVYRLRDHLPRLSAHPVLTLARGVGICAMIVGVVLASFQFPLLALAINLCSIGLFLAMAFLRFAAYRHAVHQEGPVGRDTLPTNLPPPNLQRNWPSYAVLVPLFKEGAIVPDLVRSLMRLDYPHSRLKIYLVIEEVDLETRQAIGQLSLPSVFEMVVVPDHGPRTKPKALNYALCFVDSDLTVIFDAEDRPAPYQLKEAALTMMHGNPRLACLQGRLAIDNGGESWLSRQFSVEYSALFDGLLPFLSHEKLPIPLGGTSNHFRTSILKQVGGWDPYNVTEDADLGLRLSRLGYDIGVIKSDTQEEAPISYEPWMKQRSRWFKGWMQTWLVHMRQPKELYQTLGRSGFLSFQVMIGGMLISSLIHPAYLIGIGFAIWAILTQSGTDNPAFWLLLFTNSFNLVLGYGSAMMLGNLSAKRRFGYSWRTIVQMPLYWLLMTPSAWRAFYQLLFDPHRWEKTPHGVSKGRPDLET